MGIAVVALWISIDVADSTILKPDLLIIFSFLLVVLGLGRSSASGMVLWRKTPVDIVVALYLLTLLISWGLSLYRPFGTTPLLLTCGYAVCFFAGTQLFGQREQIDQALDFMSILSLLICVVALIQFFGADQLGIQFNLGSSRRVMSTLGNATYLGGFLAMMIPLTVGRMLAGRAGKLMWALLVLMTAVLFLTQSRGAILAVAVSLVLLFSIMKGSNPRNVFVGIGISLVLFGIALFFLPGMATRLASLLSPAEDYSFARRIPFWSAGWQAACSSLFLGHGPGSTPFVVASFRDADYWVNGSEDIVPHIHNEILEVAMESGFVGMALYCALFGVVIWHGLTVRDRKQDSALGAGIACAIIAVFLDNMAGTSLRYPPVAMVAWLLAGILVSPAFHARTTLEMRIPLKRNGIVAAWFLIAAWGVFAFSYARNAADRVVSDMSLQSGRVAVKAGKQDIAQDHFRLALNENRLNLVAAFELCVSQLKTGSYTQALATAESLRVSVQEYPKLGLLESLAWLQLDSLNKASQAIDRELKTRDHPEAYYTQSLIFARLGDTVGVRQSLEMVLERNIAAYSTIHLESTCKTLLGIAGSKEDLERLRLLLEELEARSPQSAVVASTLEEVRARLRGRPIL